MATIGSKGYYVAKLKEMGIRKYENRKLEKFKGYILANLYFEELKKRNKDK